MSANRDLLRSKLQFGLLQLPFLTRVLGLVWNAAHRWTLAWLGLLVIQGLLPAVTVYLTRALVNQLVAVLQANDTASAFWSLLPLVIVMAAAVLLGELLSYAAGFVRSVQAELVRDHISGLIHNKSVEVDLAFYDMPDYYDRLYRAQYHALDRPLTLLEHLGGVLQNGITLTAMVVVVLPFGIWLPLALLVSSLPAFYILLKHRLRWHHWRLKNTEAERRTWYYNWLLTEREVAAEVRIFSLGNHFHSLFQSLRRRLRNERVQLAREQNTAELAAAAIALLTTGLALGWMLWKVVQGAFTLGDLALFYQAFHQGQSRMSALLEDLGEIYNNSLFLSDLFAFLSLEPQVAEPAQPTPVPAVLQQGICFQEVTFRYPGSQSIALCNFNLTIPAGSTVAIMGANGAGKSTLVKLLCRFYDPNDGRILLDGMDLRSFSLDALRQQITVLFQEPVHYQDTVLENIALGDLSATVDPAKIEMAARAAGADSLIERLPQQYHTRLGKWFVNGAELSVGEWQRLALARAYWRRAPILILDEPTSAMDPWAEHDWLQRFRTLAAEHTTLIITHRFTTAMHADVIHVMQAGRVVESGNHAELLALGGTYARSWHDQMQTAEGKRNFIPLRHGQAEQARPNGASV
jgi:ATP-binding cassette subfamily B protein